MLILSLFPHRGSKDFLFITAGGKFYEKSGQTMVNLAPLFTHQPTFLNKKELL